MFVKECRLFQQERFWKRRIESDIAWLRKDFSRHDDCIKVKWKKKIKKEKRIGKKYRMKAKYFIVIIEELNQRILQNLRSWDVIVPETTNIGKTNFSDATKKHYIKSYVETKDLRAHVPSNAKKGKELWSKLLDKPVSYKKDSEWLKEVEL